LYGALTTCSGDGERSFILLATTDHVDITFNEENRILNRIETLKKLDLERNVDGWHS
jgi:hypothetical protein